MVRRLGAAPSERSFGDPVAQAGARRPQLWISKLVRSAGFAPASPDWHSGILLLNDDRKKLAHTRFIPLRQLTEKNEHRCHRHHLMSGGTRRGLFHGGSFGVSGTPPMK